MADFGLRILRPGGVVEFDSILAAGGICLGFYTVPMGGGTVAFPDIITSTGMVLPTATHGTPTYTTDNTLGYLRFVFPAGAADYPVVMFAK